MLHAIILSSNTIVCILCIIELSIIMLSVIKASVVMLKVTLLS